MSLVDDAFGEVSGLTQAPRTEPSTLECCTLGVGDYLYQEAGSRPFVYRVEKGVVVIFERQIGRPVKIIAVVGEGDYFGLGCLDHHRDNARAVVDSVVTCVPRTEFLRLAEHDSQLEKKQDEAIARDFEHGRLLARDRGRSTPIECVAAFLIALSRQNAHEGRDPSIVSDSSQCVSATSLLLDMDSGLFEEALLRLQSMGVVELGAEGRLHLKNIPELEGVADGVLPPVRTALSGMSSSVTKCDPKEAHRAQMLGPFSGSSALFSIDWRTELPETPWLVFVLGGLSVTAVGLGLIIAFATL